MNTQSPLIRRIFLLAVLAFIPAIAVLPAFLAGGHDRAVSAREPVTVVRPVPPPVRDRLAVTPSTNATPAAHPIPRSIEAAAPPPGHAGALGATGSPIPWEPIDWPLVACLLVILCGAWRVWLRAGPVRARNALAVCLLLPLVGCGVPAPSQPAQSPAAYLHGALDWMQAHSLFSRRTNRTALRRDATELAGYATITARTYREIMLALQRLGDANGFFLSPAQLTHAFDAGFRATYPGRLVVDVEPGSPAARAGLRIGDIIESVNGAAPRRLEGLHSMDLNAGPKFRLVLRRPGQVGRLTVSFSLFYS